VHNYEGMFLLDNSKVKADAAECVGVVTEMLKKHQGEVVRVERWDERKLAYEIRGQKRATYILAHFKMAPEKPGELRHDVNLNESFLRILVQNVGEEFPPFLTAAEYEAMRPKKEEEPPEDMGGGGGRRRRRDDDGMDEENV
jgi:small subunit ribosomal protein S6